ncbi:hypothetical protein ACWOFR_16900 [Carnobacterium gallinarum]|uniref:hypothetical protein n=1 Tax=Carnobacterium gallinarum TaxID=2749 RepID=UPI00054E1C67|nr:hypothetical protein [Carnobacterium gallinarum]
MFEINFKLFSVEEENFPGEYGYFNFIVSDSSYGIILEDEVEIFTVSVYEWFSSFLKALNILETEDYVLINDIESFNTWIEMCRNKDIITISKISGDKVEQGGWVRKEKLSDADYKFWKDKDVLFSDFREEILEKSEKYLADLINLNSLENNKIVELDKLIKEIN